jgi:hypothetical protein
MTKKRKSININVVSHIIDMSPTPNQVLKFIIHNQSKKIHDLKNKIKDYEIRKKIEENCDVINSNVTYCSI